MLRALFTGSNGESEKTRTTSGDAHQLRETSIAYGVHFKVKKGEIGPKTPIFGTLTSNNQ